MTLLVLESRKRVNEGNLGEEIRIEAEQLAIEIRMRWEIKAISYNHLRWRITLCVSFVDIPFSCPRKTSTHLAAAVGRQNDMNFMGNDDARREEKIMIAIDFCFLLRDHLSSTNTVGTCFRKNDGTVWCRYRLSLSRNTLLGKFKSS